MSMLRRALESADETSSDEKSVVMKGPLAEVYTKALDIAYAKEAPTDSDEPVLESQAQDATLMQELARQLQSGDENTDEDYMTVYGVSKDAVSDKDIVDVTNDIASQERPADYVLILDVAEQGNGQDNTSNMKMVNLNEALESIVTSYGGKVYSSLKQFARSRK